MRIHYEYIWKFWLLLIGIGIVLALLFDRLMPRLVFYGIPSEVVFLWNLLCGVLIIGALGMMLEDASQTGGMIILAITFPLLLYFSVLGGMIMVMPFGLGLMAGIALASTTLYHNRFDILAKTLKGTLGIFFLSFIAILVYSAVVNYLYLTVAGDYTSLLVATDFPLFILASIATCVLFIFIQWNIRGIRASDIFIFGEKGSGKSDLLVALYKELVHNYGGAVPEEVIITNNAAREKQLSLGFMEASVMDGTMIHGNIEGELAMYTLKARRWAFMPVNISLLDYAGGQLDHVTRENYESTLDALTEVIDDMPRSAIAESLGTIEFLRHVKEKYPDELQDLYLPIIEATLYKRFMQSGKILFLIDGDKFVGMESGYNREIEEYFGRIAQKFLELGRNKSYGLVATKGDKFIPDIATLDAHSTEAERRETDLYERLSREYTNFKALAQTVSGTFLEFGSMYLYIVSIDPTPGPAEGSDRVPQRLCPWRFDQIVKFSFKN